MYMYKYNKYTKICTYVTVMYKICTYVTYVHNTDIAIFLLMSQIFTVNLYECISCICKYSKLNCWLLQIQKNVME